MFVYNGHGTIDLIGKPYKIGTLKYPLTTDRTRIDLLPDCDIQPLSFLFGCSMNGKATEKGSTIGMDWICSFPYKGGTSCLAATTISYIDKNNALSKAIFNQLPTNGYGNIRLGEFIQNGMTKYIGCIHPYWQKRQVLKYVLMGDPTTYIFGINGFRNPYYAPSNGTTEEPEQQDSGQENVEIYPTLADQEIYLSMRGNSSADINIVNIHGQQVYSEKGLNANAAINTASLPEGMYIVCVTTANGIKENFKIIVKH